ncbi:MAG: ABC transporter ATP-binding protein [Thermoplasmata archaeon]|nr:MAG: ABC transporter ATP-binding protein [Thermoplasmata archaeon]
MQVSTTNLTKSYGEIQALKNVSVSISGNATGLLGPNGAGKSTFLKLLLGLIPPTTGNASVLGYSSRTQALSIRQNIGYMPESECFIPNMTGITFLTYFGRLSGLSARDAIQRAHEALYYVNIIDERYRKISTYSTGMKQKLKLAQALTHDPALIFLDEPTTGLDPFGRNEMLDLLKKLVNDLDKHIIFSSHILHDIETICEDVVILNEGEMIKQGTLNELMYVHNPDIVVRIRGDHNSYVNTLKSAKLNFIVRQNDISIKNTPGAMESILQAAVSTGVQLRHLEFGSSSLEDLFVDIIQSNQKNNERIPKS